MRSVSGTAKASVLPEPVGDLASTSRPASTSPITSFWIANGSVKPRSDSARVTALDTPRSANWLDIENDSLQRHLGRERFGRLWLTRTAVLRDPSELPRGRRGAGRTN